MNELEVIKKFFVKSKTNGNEFSKQYFYVIKLGNHEPSLIIKKLVLSDDIECYKDYTILKYYKGKYLFFTHYSIKLSTFNKVFLELQEIKQTRGVHDVEIEKIKDSAIDKIQRIVCEYYNINIEQLHTKTRERIIVQARQITHYFAYKMTNKDLREIGKTIGKKNHATVIHSRKVVNNLMETDKEIKAQIEEIERKIKDIC